MKKLRPITNSEVIALNSIHFAMNIDQDSRLALPNQIPHVIYGTASMPILRTEI
jgi:hypothetical protein